MTPEMPRRMDMDYVFRSRYEQGFVRGLVFAQFERHEMCIRGRAQRVKLTFPGRDNMPKVGMPEGEVHWYDGGLMPTRPAGLPAGKNLNDAGGAGIVYGRCG